VASIEDRGTRAYVPSYEIAKVYLALGHSDDAVPRERGDRSKVALSFRAERLRRAVEES